MKHVKQFIRTFIMTCVVLFVFQGFISPEITALANRPAPGRADAAGLKMLPLGTQNDFRMIKSVRNERQ
ncbi:MAG: hypothetical protein ABIH66_10990, partial [bacterium]